MAHLNELYDAILNGDAKKAHATTAEALAAGAAPMDLIRNTWCRPWTKWAGCLRPRSISFPSFCWPAEP